MGKGREEDFAHGRRRKTNVDALRWWRVRFLDGSGSILSSFFELEERDQTRGRHVERSELDLQPDPPTEIPDFDQWFSAVFA